MYTTKNTNIDIIQRNYEKLKDKAKDNCVLIITGSFNPIHRSHIYNLQIVKKYLENHDTRSMNVLAAYISPTHDSYVRHKLGNDWISAKDRCKLCEEAIKYENLEDFISVSKGEIECDAFLDFDEVSENLAKFLNLELCGTDKLLENPLKVVYVCGLDHFNKCPYVAQLAQRKNMACAVIYRLNASDDHIKTFDEKSSNIYYITLEDEREKLIDISSTAIRQLYRTQSNTDSDNLSYPCVMKYYKDKLNKN